MSDDPNPYAPPRVSLDERPKRPRGQSPHIEGSLEGALRGEIDLPPLDVFNEARALAKGAKLAIWLAAILVGFLFLVGLFLTDALSEGDEQVIDRVASVLSIAFAPFTAGGVMMGVRRAVGAKLEAAQVVAHFDRALALFVGSAVVALFSALPEIVLGLSDDSGLFVFVLPYNALIVMCTFFWIPLLIDREMSIFEALATSTRVGLKGFFAILWFVLVTVIISVVLIVITLGIGIIWVFPWAVLMNGIAYRRVFGVERVRE